jgi:hypothetical protein
VIEDAAVDPAKRLISEAEQAGEIRGVDPVPTELPVGEEETSAVRRRDRRR